MQSHIWAFFIILVDILLDLKFLLVALRFRQLRMETFFNKLVVAFHGSQVHIFLSFFLVQRQ